MEGVKGEKGEDVLSTNSSLKRPSKRSNFPLNGLKGREQDMAECLRN